jgi:hypothetical protein
MDERRFDEETTLLATIELSILGSGAKRPDWGWSDGVVRETEEERSCGFNDGFKGAQSGYAVGGRQAGTKTQQVMTECIGRLVAGRGWLEPSP